jgi:hypothetical protein
MGNFFGLAVASTACSKKLPFDAAVKCTARNSDPRIP